MPQQIQSISDLPNVPAVYALYGGNDRTSYVAYVGLASKLRTRIEQHLVKRDSSVVTGVTAVALKPEYVTALRWWENPDFDKQDVLEAAELVAFDVLDPALRSRGGVTERAKALYHDAGFVDRMRSLFASVPTGLLRLPTMADVIRRLNELEGRMAMVERQLTEGG